MSLSRFASVIILACCCASFAQAGTEAVNRHIGGSSELVAPNFEMAAESAYLLGAIGNPHSYEIGTQFITARWRWGVNPHDGFWRGYNQVYLLAMGEAIFRGPENYYFGISTGLRYNFAQPGWRLIPYVSGGVGLGWIDSHANIHAAQGQDFTFNILTAAGFSYPVNDHWKIQVGALYQHFSNAGQTQPNASLNAFGPQLGATYAF
ncbi:MAG: acyloxyacyl hydrolase [Chthoniobacterales bacterium]